MTKNYKYNLLESPAVYGIFWMIYKFGVREHPGISNRELERMTKNKFGSGTISEVIQQLETAGVIERAIRTKGKGGGYLNKINLDGLAQFIGREFVKQYVKIPIAEKKDLLKKLEDVDKIFAEDAKAIKVYDKLLKTDLWTELVEANIYFNGGLVFNDEPNTFKKFIFSLKDFLKDYDVPADIIKSKLPVAKLLVKAQQFLIDSEGPNFVGQKEWLDNYFLKSDLEEVEDEELIFK